MELRRDPWKLTGISAYWRVPGRFSVAAVLRLQFGAHVMVGSRISRQLQIAGSALGYG